MNGDTDGLCQMSILVCLGMMILAFSHESVGPMILAATGVLLMAVGR